jgi:hypothetical protein
MDKVCFVCRLNGQWLLRCICRDDSSNGWFWPTKSGIRYKPNGNSNLVPHYNASTTRMPVLQCPRLPQCTISEKFTLMTHRLSLYLPSGSNCKVSHDARSLFLGFKRALITSKISYNVSPNVGLSTIHALGKLTSLLIMTRMIVVLLLITMLMHPPSAFAG